MVTQKRGPLMKFMTQICAFVLIYSLIKHLTKKVLAWKIILLSQTIHTHPRVRITRWIFLAPNLHQAMKPLTNRMGPLGKWVESTNPHRRHHPQCDDNCRKRGYASNNTPTTYTTPPPPTQKKLGLENGQYTHRSLRKCKYNA